MVETLTAFHGLKSLKIEIADCIEAHRQADEIVKGKTGQGGKGCAVWCAFDKYDHKAYETKLGIPEWLALLEDHLFEGMPNEQAMTWPGRFIDAIPVGAKNWGDLYHDFMYYLMVDPLHGVIKNAGTEYGVKEAVERVAQLHAAREKNSEKWDQARSAAESAAMSARSAARSAESAAESAAWSAARSAWSARSAESAARSAAESAWSAWSAMSAAMSAAESAAWSAARSAESAWSAWSAWSAMSAAESAARSAACRAHSEKLIELLKDMQ